MKIQLALFDGKRVYWVDLDYYNSILELVIFILPALIPGARYTTEKLLGPEFWAPLGDAGKQLVGRCIVDMVRNGRLPLRRIGCRHRRPAQYELMT